MTHTHTPGYRIAELVSHVFIVFNDTSHSPYYVFIGRYSIIITYVTFLAGLLAKKYHLQQ